MGLGRAKDWNKDLILEIIGVSGQLGKAKSVTEWPHARGRGKSRKGEERSFRAGIATVSRRKSREVVKK